MDFEYLLGGFATLFMLGYLLYALLKAEKF